MRANTFRELWPVWIALLVRVTLWLLQPAGRFASDEDSYYRVATLLLTTGEQDLFWPPGTGWLIAFVATILQTADIRWIRLAWVLMDVGCVLAIFALARTIAAGLASRAAAQTFTTTATLGYALYLPAMSFAQFATSEVPALLLVLLAALASLRGELRTSRAVVVGALLGALSITRPSLLPLALLVPVARSAHASAAHRLRWAATATLVSAMVVGAVVARNWWIAGEPTIAQNSAYNLYIGNRPLYAEDLDLFHPVATAGQVEFRRQYFSGELTYPTQPPEELQREAFAWIAEHPGQFARRALGRLARVFAPKTDVLELLGGERAVGIFSPQALTLLAITNVQWLVVLFGGLVGLAGLYRLQRPIGVLFVAVVVGSLPLTLIAISKPRYAFTFEPLLLVAAAYLLVERRAVRAALTQRDRWVLAACAAFLLWGWAAWLIFATTSRVALTGTS